jgi:hypothetical protein
VEKITLKIADRDSPFGRYGEVVELALTPTDVHVPEELPTYLAGYKIFEYRADELSPPLLVDNDSDYFRSFSSDDAFEPVVVKTGQNGKHNVIDTRSSTTKYTVVDRVIGSFINSITERQSKQLFNQRQSAMKRCQRVLMMDREIDVSTQASTLGSFATGNQKALGAGFNWNGGANSDPVLDIQARCEASAQPVTDIALSLKTRTPSSVTRPCAT